MHQNVRYCTFDEHLAQTQQDAAARQPIRFALMKSRFMREMVSMLISFGHASWHSPYSVQLPKFSRSI